MIAHYRSRVSGPLLDRFDIHVEVPPLPISELREVADGERSEKVAARVAAARRLQEERFAGTGCRSNAEMTPDLLCPHALPDEAGQRILHLAIRRLGLSARAHDGSRRVARTIADLEGSNEINAVHVAEAAQYRALDRRWGMSSEYA